MQSQIYALVDPRDRSPFYVGETRTRLGQRLSGHLVSARTQLQQGRVSDRIREIVSAGARPEIVDLETVPRAERYEAESFWLASLKMMGCRLLNVADGARRVWTDETRALQREAMRQAHARGVQFNNAKPMKVAVRVGDAEFESIAAAASAHDVCRHTIGRWVRIGKATIVDLESSSARARQTRSLTMQGRGNPQFGKVDGLSAGARPVVIDGVQYDTMAAACAALGVSRKALYNWLRSGRVAERLRLAATKRVQLFGREYSSLSQAAYSHGVNPASLRYWLLKSSEAAEAWLARRKVRS